MKKKILLVEDNIEINKSNTEALEMEGYDVYTALSIAEAREHLKSVTPDIILLDVMLDDGNGMDFCKELRAEGHSMPVMFITCIDEKAGLVDGLQSGGDMYMSKPYSLDELLARVEAMVRRVSIDHANPPREIVCGPLTLDIMASRAYLNNVDLLLKPKEFALLLIFVKHPGKQFSPEELYSSVWGMTPATDARTIKTHIYRLRQKLQSGDKVPFSIEMINRKSYVWNYLAE